LQRRVTRGISWSAPKRKAADTNLGLENVTSGFKTGKAFHWTLFLSDFSFKHPYDCSIYKYEKENLQVPQSF